MFLDNEFPHYQLGGVSFATYSDEEIKGLSVKEVTNPQSFDNLMHPTFGGLYDPALGPTERDDLCTTCGQHSLHCPGHMGYIQLPVPVYNPVFFDTLHQIMRGSCFSCHRLYADRFVSYLLIGQMKLLDHGLLSNAQQLLEIYNQVKEDCEGGVNIAQMFLEQMNLYVAKTLKDIDPTVTKTQAKHTVEYRQSLVKAFIKNHMGSRTGACSRCRRPLRPLRKEHNIKMYFSKGISKLAAAKLVRNTSMKKPDRPENAKDETIETEDVEMENENPNDNEMQKDLDFLGNQTFLTPSQAREHTRNLWENDGETLKYVFGALRLDMKNTKYPSDIFFLDVIAVPPSRFRPVSIMRDKRFENPQTANLSRVLADAITIRHVLTAITQKSSDTTDSIEEGVKKSSILDDVRGKTVEEKLHNALITLQMHANCVVDSNLDRLSTDKFPGIKQLLEKKEGLFRKHMMGKRVDYAARSVISPDPYIATNEIGIPQIFAKKLTYPQPVTPWNVQELRQAVINGPAIHPGAAFVMNEDGTKVVLSASNKTQREAIAKQLLTPSVHGSRRGVLGPKKVFRHLKNGDVLLLNRQPTLHRPSIQAHKARILPGEKTLRLHYANCKAYNADFDGDEMNAHFPQNDIARAEAYTIASTEFQYLVPKDGTPLAGLIQDHMVSGTSLTIRGRFFNRWDYQQLVYGGLIDKRGAVRLLRPSILKPCHLWSGKQVVSTVLLNLIPTDKSALNLVGKAKINEKNWIKQPSRPWKAGGSVLKDGDMGESQVVITQGELICGVLDKAHYGATPYSLVHCCYEIYGGEIAGQLLTCLARLFTIFLQIRGFTLGVEDILCKPKADQERCNIMKKGRKCGNEAAAKAMGVDDATNTSEIQKHIQAAHLSKEDTGMKELDLSVKAKTDDFQNQIAKVVIPLGLHKIFPDNNLQLMVQSGAKGSSVNCMQISCLLGQIELEGRRPTIMVSGRSLPSFLPYDTSFRAGGFIDGRFLTGIRPQEYFFHCMAGREGLVDTAVKTSRSGYLQRCIVKHLEGIIVNYDHTVRDSDGSIIQFLYGEDGLDVPKTQFLNRKQFPFLVHNQEAVINKENLKQIEKNLDKDSAEKLQKQIRKWQTKNPEGSRSVRQSGFLKFCKKHETSFKENVSENKVLNTGRSELASALLEKWRDMSDSSKQKYSKHLSRCPDPALSTLGPQHYFGSVSEKLSDILQNYFKTNPDKLIHPNDSVVPAGHISEDRFKTLLFLRYLQSLVEPGEAVGLLAAQSIGEPSTQMTLNTFHFAGRGEMNVTLGIPRLREILMVASANIKTPAMDVPVLRTEHAKRAAKVLQQKFTKVYLHQVLEKVEVCEYLAVKVKTNRNRMYRIRFHFLPHQNYREEYHLTPSKILNFMEKKFVHYLCTVIKSKLLKMSEKRVVQSATVRSRIHRQDNEDDNISDDKPNEDDDVSDDDLNDGDAAATKYRERQQQERDYPGEEEEKDEMGSSEAESDVELDVGDDDESVSTPSDNSRPTTPVHDKSNKKRRKSKQVLDANRFNKVMLADSLVAGYDYDIETEEWCEILLQLGMSDSKVDIMSLVETEAKKAVVYETPALSRAFLSESKFPSEKGLLRLKTEGVNIMEMYHYGDILDLNGLYSNDIHAVANTYGIEAAGRVIVKEIKDVFAAYGIEVDPRHLSLVADYMTFEGVYKPFNRIGMESSASPLQKMSFETTMHFLKSATISGDKDDLKSPSSRIVVGRLVSGGTGCFDLLQPLS